MPTGYYSCAADDTSGLEAEQAINRLSAFPYIEVDSVDEQHSRAARPGARGEVTRGVGEKFRAAACAAEIVGDAKRFRGVARARDLDAHAAHRIHRLAHRRVFRLPRCRLAPAALHNLRHDAHCDLLARTRSQGPSRAPSDALDGIS